MCVHTCYKVTITCISCFIHCFFFFVQRNVSSEALSPQVSLLDLMAEAKAEEELCERQQKRLQNAPRVRAVTELKRWTSILTGIFTH